MTACADSDSGPGGTKAQAPTTEKMNFEAAPDSALGKILERGSIRIGVKYDVPQFGLRNPVSNQVEGFEVDLAHYIASALFGDPSKVELVEALNANRIPFLQGDKVDLVISQLTITPERRQQVDFSDVYYSGQLRLLAKKDSSITGVESLAGKKVCTSAGSTAIPILKARAPQAEVVPLPSNSEWFDALSDGRVDAEAADDSSLAGFIVKNNQLELKGDALDSAPYGVGIKKGQPELIEAINKIIAQHKSSGAWQKSYDNWVLPVTKTKATPPPATA